MANWSILKQRWSRLRSLWQADSLAGFGDLLSQADPKAPLYVRLQWFTQVIAWLKKDTQGGSGSPGSSVRFRYFFQAMDQNERWKEKTRETFVSTVEDASFLEFFSNTGFSADHGLWSDLSRRLLARLVPSDESDEFQQVLFSIFRSEDDADWVSAIPDEVIGQLGDFLAPEQRDRLWQAIQPALTESLLILSANVAHHGLGQDIRRRLHLNDDVTLRVPLSAGRVSFLNLGLALQKLLLDAAAQTANPSGERRLQLIEEVQTCRTDVAVVYKNMEASGVSVALVHKLEVLGAALDQIEELLKLQVSEPGRGRWLLLRDFFAKAARSAARGRSIRSHLGEHLYLLSRKISERNGQSGEHYIARDATGLRELFRSGISGGFIVVLMTFFKTLLLRNQPAPLFLALGLWFIYAAGFLIMQRFGATLATKLPSFTANHLARKLKEYRKESGHQEFRSELVLAGQSQLVAFVGNVVGLLPICVGVSWVLKAFFHWDLMDEHYARHTLGGLNPIASSAAFLGVLTGVELWISSICGGWFENWVVYKGVPKALTRNPHLLEVFGTERMNRFSEGLLKNVSGIAANVSLGFLFGFMPLLGFILGLDLESKHVTLSTAGAAFAVSTLGFSLRPSEWLATSAGLVLVGLLNFAVSFLLALFVASRSQKVKSRFIWRALIPSVLWK